MELVYLVKLIWRLSGDLIFHVFFSKKSPDNLSPG